MTDSSNNVVDLVPPPPPPPPPAPPSTGMATNTFFSQITDLTTAMWSPIAVPVIDNAKNMLSRYITSATTHMVPTHTGYPVAVHEMLGSAQGTLVVIHGLASCSSDWVEFLKLAQYKFGRILAVDLPGHGESPLPPEFMDVDTTCEFKWLVSTIIESILATTSQHEMITLVGNSLGSAVAAKIASVIPSRFAHLVLISPAGYPCDDAEKVRLFHIFSPKTFTDCCATVDAMNFKPIHRALNIASGFILKDRVSSPVVRMVCNSIGEFPNDFIFVKSEDLEMITAKTLIIWGTEDNILPAKHVTHFTSIRNLTVELWPDTGHCPQTESPLTVVSRISDFVVENELEAVDE